MRSKIAIVYNEPETSRYDLAGESTAVTGVLEAVSAVREALLELGHEVSAVSLTPADRIRPLIGSLGTDLVFNLFEGFAGLPETEALLPEILEDLGLPYTGCPAPALRIAADKARTSSALLKSGINVPAYQLLTPASLEEPYLDFPCIVKPMAEHASHGLTEDSVVRDRDSLARQVSRVCRQYGSEALVEEFIDGREFNATVLGNDLLAVLPVSEIEYDLPPDKPRILTFAAKWQQDTDYFSGTRAVCPARIEEGLRDAITALTLSAFKIGGCRGYARVDLRMDRAGRLYVLEINPNPDISPTAGIIHQAKAAGMGYTQFVDKIISLALEHQRPVAAKPV